MTDEALSDSIFEYRGEFNSKPVRAMLGLDGHPRQDLPDYEIERLIGMLVRGGYISEEEIKLQFPKFRPSA